MYPFKQEITDAFEVFDKWDHDYKTMTLLVLGVSLLQLVFAGVMCGLFNCFREGVCCCCILTKRCICCESRPYKVDEDDEFKLDQAVKKAEELIDKEILNETKKDK